MSTSTSPFKKAAVLGWPVSHSLSPRLHTYWLHQYGLEGSYEALAVEPRGLSEALRKLQAQGYNGVNITVPHKEEALRYIKEAGGIVDPLAARVGAVNTVLFHEKAVMEGRNTDVYGFKQNLLNGGFQITDKPAMVLGAGGAARAVIVALQDMGARHIKLANRTLEKAQFLAHEFSTPQGKVDVVPWEKASSLASDICLLVNTTSLGMKDIKAPAYFDFSYLPKEAIVTDIVYTPLLTVLLNEAKIRGNRIVDGLGMLLYQGQPAFKAFFGYDPDVTAGLRQHMLEGLKA